MGANCSHDSSERYEKIKLLASKSKCMKLHALDGLLPKKEGNPIILMGEHHDMNEGPDCLSVLNIVENSVSNCDENNSSVYFLYENPIISENSFFEKENPSIPFFDGQDELDNIQGTRAKIFIHAKDFNNIKAQPIEVFGRMRYFNFNKEIRNSVHTQQVAINELKEFWKDIGYPDDYISFISPKAIKLAEETTDVFFSKNPLSFLTRTEVLEVFTCTYLAKLSLVVNESIPEKNDSVIEQCDKIIEIFMSNEPELYNPEQFSDLVGEIEEIRYSIRMFLMFELIAISGDMVAYEYISYLKLKNILLLVHAGFNHTNRIRKWLLASEYNSDFEKVTDLAINDPDFNISR